MPLSDLILNLRVPEKEPVEVHPGPNLSYTNSNDNFDLPYSLFDLSITSASASAVVQPAPMGSRHVSSKLNTPESSPTFSVTSLVPSVAFCERTIPILTPSLVGVQSSGFKQRLDSTYRSQARPKRSRPSIATRDAIVGPNLPLKMSSWASWRPNLVHESAPCRGRSRVIHLGYFGAPPMAVQGF
jgi:hypothetical protein